jgi:hypothetical protein
MSDAQPRSDVRPWIGPGGDFFNRLWCALLGSSVNKD